MVDTSRSRRSTRRLVLRALVATCCTVPLGTNVIGAADLPRELHGSADAFASPGVALAWGVLRGLTEVATAVVLRIVSDPVRFAWIGVVGIDPFTKLEQPLRPATPSSGAIDVRAARTLFAEFPRTEVRLYESEATARAGTPALVVYYLGVPDTTPEFATEDKLQAYLGERIARVRSAGGGKTP